MNVPPSIRPLAVSTAAALLCALVLPAVEAATFPGTARITVNDPSGSLSWSNGVDQISVSCWFQISVPSGATLSEHMTIITDRQGGDETAVHAYNIRFNVNTGNIEFTTRGASGFFTNNLIERPYMDRWYHVAVVRQQSAITGYVDGREVFTATPTVGSAANTDGVSIGGWGTGKYLYGEVQEVAIYQQAISQEFITQYMFQDQPAASESSLKGYYKLAASTNTADRLRNFAAPPPTGTDPATQQGSVQFDEVDEAGEQSLFDSRRNGGQGAIAPLSGAFSWNQTVLARPTPGIAFDLRTGYSSANTAGGAKLGSYDPYAASTVGPGWRHTFDTRMIPADKFLPIGGVDAVGLMTWDGSIETWDYDPTNDVYRTRHKEYRGELRSIGFSFMEWTTPERLVYKFRHPASGAAVMRGRLVEIRDPSSNAVQVLWKESSGVVTQITDSAGGKYNLNYIGTLLTNVSFQSWNIWFDYDGQNRLTNKSVTTTSPGVSTNVNTRWAFTYDATSGLLNAIVDPRGSTNAFVLYDKYGRMTNTVDAIGRVTKTEYDVPATRQIRRTDPAGFQWIETYDRKGRMLSQADPLANATSYTYDDAGNRTSITEPLGWKTTFSYDNRANVLSKTNALGQVWTWTYHGTFNKPLTERDPLNNTTTYTYNDSTGNLLSQVDSVGQLVSYTYTTNGLVQTATDANGKVTAFTYNSDGFLASRTDPANNTTSYTRNEVGWVLLETNALSQVTSYSYDINGNVIQIVDPLFRILTKTYDPNGNLTAQSDAKAQLTRYGSDATNQRTNMVDRTNTNSWTYTYTTRGEREKIIDPLGSVVSNAYDNANRLVAVFDPLSNVSSNIYDNNGNKIALMDKVGQRWSKTYDRLNRVIAESDPFGDTKTTTYDAAGRIKTITTPNGYPSTHDYDPRGRLTKWVDAEGFNWLYGYDGNGNIVDITDALGGHFVMVYSNRNERVSEENQDHFKWRYTYDELLRLKTQTDPNGTLRTVTYDDGGRITTVAFGTGRADSFIYDDNNNPHDITRFVPPASFTTSHFEYDVMDRVKKYRDTFNKEVLYSYDAVGRVKTLTYPDNKALTYNYDKLGRLTNTVDWASRNMWYDYDKANRLTRRTYPNGITQTNAFDNAGRLTDLQYKTPTNSVLIALSYAYDRNGNKTGEAEQGTFNWPQPSMHNETAHYTPSGRLMDKTDTGVASNNFTYVYDAAGNMTNAISAAQSFALTYDEDNRVTSLFWDYKLPIQFTKLIQNRYDALGRRVSRKVDGIESRYALDLQGSMERILCDMNASGQITAYYIHGPDLCYKVEAANNNLTCYHADAQANVIALTDSNATTVVQYAYTPYGRSLTSSNSQITNAYLFVGSQGVMEDPPGSGLYFMRARYYSADTGTFLSTDPVKHMGPGWRSVLYAYADNNPLSFTDPTGLIVVLLGAQGAASIGAVVGLEGAVSRGLAVDPLALSRGDLLGGIGVYTTFSGGVQVGAGAEISGSAEAGVDWGAAGVNDLGGWGGYVGASGGFLGRGGGNVGFDLTGKPTSFTANIGLEAGGHAAVSAGASYTTVQTAGSMLKPFSAILSLAAPTMQSGNGAQSPMSQAAPSAFVYAENRNQSQSNQPISSSNHSGTTTVSSNTGSGGGSSGNTAFSKTVSTVKQVVSTVANNVSTVVKNVTTAVKQAVNNAVSAVKSFFSGGKKK